MSIEQPERHRRGPGVERLHGIRSREAFTKKYLSGKAVLDIGFRGGAPDASPVVDHAIGVDLDFPGYDGIRLPFPARSQNAVFVSHCLEHIVDYRAALAEWYRILKFGGYLIITVPHQHLYERKARPPSRFNADHKRFYTSGSLLAEVEQALPISGFRIRSLREIDEGFDYAVPLDQHAKGCYDIELLVEKIEVPRWAPLLTRDPSEPERLVLEKYAELILELSKHQSVEAKGSVEFDSRMVDRVPLPSFVALLQQLGGLAPERNTLRQILKPYIAASRFDHDYYIKRYPDIMAAVRSGSLPNPRQHFIDHGYFEGRFGHPEDPWSK